MSMNAIQALKKAHKAVSISRDDHSLQEYVIRFQDKATKQAPMTIVGIETKFVQSRKLVSDFNPSGCAFRTRFTLEDGETVGTFSNAAHAFFKFFAGVMGYDIHNLPDYMRIDIKGKIIVNVEKIELDDNQYSYNFDLVEEGSELLGLGEYRIDMSSAIRIESSEAQLAIEAPIPPTNGDQLETIEVGNTREATPEEVAAAQKKKK